MRSLNEGFTVLHKAPLSSNYFTRRGLERNESVRTN